MTGLKVIALIPARSGSKRLPGKNLKTLGGIPLIAWSIKVALGSGCFDRVIVSTDSEEIKSVALEYGAEVPFIRSGELSSDTASSSAVALDALEQMAGMGDEFDVLVLLQPTSPYRTVMSIREVVASFLDKALEGVISVSPSKDTPQLSLYINEDGLMEPIAGWAEFQKRSQELREAWTVNGSIYAVRVEKLKADHKFTFPGVKCFKMFSDIEGIDIDTLEDFNRAETLLQKHQL